MRILAVVAVLIFPLAVVSAQSEKAPALYKSVKFKAADGLEVSAELYLAKSKKAPVILLCHQARSSRGEYRRIAPVLVAAGYNCLAIDQRSGDGRHAFANQITNETAARAAKAKKPTGYLDAKQDIVAALEYLTKEGFVGKRGLWGSSYSASLALVVASEREDLAAVLSFAPGEYFRSRPGIVTSAARKLTVPTMIVAPERERRQAEPLHKAVAAKKKELVIGADILHGSRTLFLAKEPAPTWKKVKAFLAAQLGTE